MGGYEIPGPSGPPSELERYLFAASGLPTPRVCCLATASGDAPEFIARFYEVCEALPCIPGASRTVPRPRRRGPRRVLRRVRHRLRAGRQHREHARRVARRTGSTACSRNAPRPVTSWSAARARAACAGSTRATRCRSGRSCRCTTGWAGSPAASARTRSSRAGSSRTPPRIRDGSLPSGWALDDGAALHFVDGRLHSVIAASDAARVHAVDREGAHLHAAERI